MSRTSGLIEIYEQAHAQEICSNMPCAHVACCNCPFEDEESFKEHINLLKMVELIDD